PKEAMKKRIVEICQKEGVKITEDGIEAILYISGGDFRRAINALQGAAAIGEVVDKDKIFQITATAQPEEIAQILEIALKGNFVEAREKLSKLMLEYGMSGEDVIAQLFREITSSNMNEKLKVLLIDKLGEIDFRLTEGANERIQLSAFLAYVSTLAKK
ncbi:MAG: Replication factor C small subunit, partial [Archaeoglobaceae archaeon]